MEASFDPTLSALVSIHDVMPSTLDRVERILSRIAETNRGPVTLLVVPGSGWDEAGIEQLAAWQRHGHSLAAHGWHHFSSGWGGPMHWLHGLLISRKVAEHLALDAAGIAELLARSHAWFAENGLEAPTLYVPPAWALGAISPQALASLPFRYYELLQTVYDAKTGRRRAVPMLGYQADAPLRAPAIRLWNHLQRHRAKKASIARIAIHPDDLDLPMVIDLLHDLGRAHTFSTYDRAFREAFRSP